MKNTAIFLLIMFLGFPGFVQSEIKEKNREPQSPRNQWMKGKYGIMVHWLAPYYDTTKKNKTPLPEKGVYKSDLNEAVNGFDVNRFMKDFDQSGAEWLIFTIGQNTGTYASPNSVIDSLVGPGHTPKRDLVLEIAKAVKKRGKRFIAYLPCEIRKNESLLKGFAWNAELNTDQAEFQWLYLKAVREWAVRFGKNLDGWWFDGCYSNHPIFDNKQMKWEAWYDAARAGNKDAVLTFNDGSYLVSIIKPPMPEHDYLSGEEQAIIDGKLRLGLKKEGYQLYLPESAYVEGTQCLNHTLLPIDAYWAHGNGISPDWANFPYKAIYTSTPDGMEPPIYTNEQLLQFVKNYTSIGGAVTLNAGIFQEGHIGKLTLKQLQNLRRNYKKWKIPSQTKVSIAKTSNLEVTVNEEKGKNSALFVNDICLPSKLYMLSGVQNDIFVEPLIKRWRPYNDVVRFSGTAKFQRRLLRVASINVPVDATTIKISLINQDKFDTIKSITSAIVVGEQVVGADTVIVSIIGDSFTQGAFFKDALLKKGYIPKIRMIGLRDVEGYPGQFDEGRGGWTLGRYFSVTVSGTDAYNGFWQPDGVCKYWGSTQFWKLANDIRLNSNKGWTFNESYNAGRFYTQSLLFDEKTGYKLSPKVNDIMYNNTLEHYVRFDGKDWSQINYSDYSWKFDYGKYLSMWKLKAPSILAEFLGLNDFRGAPSPAMIDFTTWNTQIERVAASYLKAVPTGKFVLMIPSSTCGILDNIAGDFTTKQNACMWEVRRNIIDNFDRRESENIYVVDSGIAVDDLNGISFTTDTSYTKPYSEYTGKERIAVQTGNPHPNQNYPNMGVSLAAFIQKYR